MSMDLVGRVFLLAIKGETCCKYLKVSDVSGGVRIANTSFRYFHYVNTIQNPTYLDELKLLGWDYINYVGGWPVLSYT